MKTLRNILGLAFAALLLVAGTSDVSFASPPVGINNAGQSRSNFFPTYQYQGSSIVTAGSTFATTAYADLANSSITVVPTHNDPTAAGKSALATPQADLLKVTWNLDVVKATATTLTCALYANGAVIAASARTIDTAAKNTTMSETWVVANSVVGSQTVKLQCKSGDTNTGTVNFGQITVEEIVF